jgi:hypothetical protein
MTDHTDICFLDTETLGLHPDAPIWEFAAIRRLPNGDPKRTVNITIRHDPAGWLDDFPDEFAHDYRTRYNPSIAWEEQAAALEIHSITRGAHIVGAVPSFDTERLAKLLRRNNIEPQWHYHLVDIENVVVGYLAGKGKTLEPPWKSDTLSAAIDIDPTSYARHTALGDVQWTMEQWDVVMNTSASSRHNTPRISL